MRCNLVLAGFLLFVFILGIAVPVYADLNTGLVAYYPFNGNANDLSGNNNNGNQTPSVRYGGDRFGINNSAAVFDGTTNTYVDVPALTTFQYRPATYCAWFKLAAYLPQQTPGLTMLMMPLMGRERCGDAYEGAIIIASETAYGYASYLLYYTGSSAVWFGKKPLLQAWTHVAMTIDSTNRICLYYNGEKVADQVYPYSQHSQFMFRIGGPSLSLLGAGYGNSRYFWNGMIDDVRIYSRALASQDIHELYLQNVATSHNLPSYVYDGVNGPHTIRDLTASSNRFSFVFATTNLGAQCVVSWSSNLRQWFPLIQFNAATPGTEVLDFSRDPSKFYRTTYLPAGVSTAEVFDYPIGTGTVDEQIEPEQNNLYTNGLHGTTERPTSSQPIDIAKWRNAQDVGSYLMTLKGPGYHPGEDWNLGSGSDDIGEQIRAVANGVVVDISPLNNNSNGGWAMVLRHYLSNGEVIHIIYAHIAPPNLADHSTPNSDGAIGSEGWFRFQEGMPVSKGAVIAVVGDVDATFYPDHLHFEMRSKAIPNLPVPPGEAAISFYWPHSMGNAYYESFSLMQEDGIIDPSDFIDDHRE